jgi:nonribosomal peptide synthetase protein VioF
MTDIDLWDILTPADHQLYADLNATDTELPRRTVVDSILAAAGRDGSAVAVRVDGTEISYGELVRRAHGVAAWLAGLGVRKGDVVAVFLDKRAELYPVLLGALLAGVVVAPLDVSAPTARTGRCAALVAARLVITVPELSERAPRTAPMAMADDWMAGTAAPGAGLAIAAPGWDDAVYVMFTSGTTGIPKPVLIGHAALANLVQALTGVMATGPGSRVTQSAPMHFDASWHQILCAWTRGSALVPVPDEVRVSGAGLAAWLAGERITHVDMVPSLWYPMVDHLADSPGTPRPDLSVLLLAGEALRADKVRRWQELSGGNEMILNVYGPTEVTIDATYHVWRGGTPGDIVPIGTPLPNLRAYVLNESLALCPAGVIGELYLGGAGLAAGYLAHPAATADRFLPDPFSATPGGRMYATGDRVRLLPSGELQFEGRLDDVVKIRGVRIDLGEVEAAIRNTDGVDAAAVIPAADGGSLAGFYVCSGAPVDSGTVFTRLAEHLPPSHIPRRLLRLESLPQTLAGKLDRAALSVIAARCREEAGGEQRAATPMEQRLLAIWQDVLKQPVDLDANFFALGGDSIASIVVRDRALDQGLRFDILDLFKAPTVRQLATLTRQEPVRPAMAAQPEAGSALPLLPGQENIFWEALASGDQSAFCVQEVYYLDGGVDAQLLAVALNVLADRHPALRAEFLLEEGKPRQRIWERPEAGVGVTAAGHDFGAAVSQARRDAVSAISLDVWPLFDLRLVDAGEKMAMIWTMHHIFADGWSHALLRDELFSTYTQLRDGSFLAFTDRVDRYQEYALTTEQRIRPDAAGFWREHLRDAEPVRLPRDGLPGAARSARVARRIEGGLRATLTASARRVGVPENTILMTALSASIQRLTGRCDVSLLYVTSGRAELEHSQDTVGCLINTVPVRVHTARPLPPDQLVPVVSEALMAVRPYEATPLRQVCQAAGRDSVQALSEVLFLFQTYPETGMVDELSESGKHGFSIRGYEGAEVPQLPISMTCHPLGNGDLALDIDYWPAVLRRQTVEAFAEMFTEAVAAATGGQT